MSSSRDIRKSREDGQQGLLRRLRGEADALFSVTHGVMFAASLAACSSDGPDSLRDSSAAAVLQEAWKEDVWLFNLGPIQFRRGDSSGPGYTMYSRYPWYRVMAEKGLIKLETERDLSGGFSGWNDFFALTQAGVQRTATVVLTSEGAKIGSLQNAGTGSEFVTFVVGGYQIEGVVSNEALDINGDKYRVIQGTHAFDPKPDFIGVMEDLGQDTSRDRRFRALLKYDVFGSKWKLQIADVGRRDVDFQSQLVPSTLAQLRLTGGR